MVEEAVVVGGVLEGEDGGADEGVEARDVGDEVGWEVEIHVCCWGRGRLDCVLSKRGIARISLILMYAGRQDERRWDKKCVQET